MKSDALRYSMFAIWLLDFTGKYTVNKVGKCLSAFVLQQWESAQISYTVWRELVFPISFLFEVKSYSNAEFLFPSDLFLTGVNDDGKVCQAASRLFYKLSAGK